MTVKLEDVRRAAERLAPIVHRTPMVRSRQLDARTGREIYLKAECLQRAGSFKVRGAYNTIASLAPEVRARGIVSYSSGNHAQGVALAAQRLGLRAVVFVPETILPAKRAATEAYGAEIVVAGTTSEDRERAALEAAEREGWVVVRPYDDPNIIAGQGTVALEMLQDVPDLDVIIAPIGGGGLMAGTAVTARALAPKIHIVGIEAEDANDTYLSVQAGRRVRIPPPRTIADGMRAIEPGELTFPIVQALVDEIVLVSDPEIVMALRFLLERTKLLVEPTAAVGVAALLAGRIPQARGRKVGVVLSGGNIDLEGLARILGSSGRA